MIESQKNSRAGFHGQKIRLAVLTALTIMGMPSVAFAKVDDARVERLSTGRLIVTWKSDGPADVYASDDPAAGLGKAVRVSTSNRKGRIEVDAGAGRRYFTIRDRADNETVKVAERLVPLNQGTNFRDLGGYPAAGGKHVRWGMIMRSGSTALLDAKDLDSISRLNLQDIVDLRSNEERSLAPNKIDSARYHAIGYPMAKLIPELVAPGAAAQQKASGYDQTPTFISAHARLVFSTLLAGKGPMSFFCSGGQDRTGVMSALVLSALGTPRPVIEADYQLTTRYLRTSLAMPRVTREQALTDPTAALFARFQDAPPQRLYDANGKSLLAGFFDAIDARWGSVDSYLRREIGLTDADLANLQEIYLE